MKPVILAFIVACAALVMAGAANFQADADRAEFRHTLAQVRASQSMDRHQLAELYRAVKARLEHDAADLDACHQRIRFEDAHLTVLYHRMGHGERPSGGPYGEWPERPEPANPLPVVVEGR